MIATPIKTKRVTPGMCSLRELLDDSLRELSEGSVLAITSKVVSLCENRVVPGDTDKEELIKRESDRYMDREDSKYGYHFTIVNHTLAAAAGIDESNGSGGYILWPRDSQATANDIRAYLAERFGLERVGVVITDSASRPMRLGASGIALGFSGFKGLRDYRGQPDLFGRPFKVSRADIAGGLAATAVLLMGEGNECTPFVTLADVPGLTFVPRDPTPEELETLNIQPEDDLFDPFLSKATWLPGGGSAKN
jgi:F420-0:gamma-glutamyl ligase